MKEIQETLRVSSMDFEIQLESLKPIFHCDAKPFPLGTGVGLATFLCYLMQKMPTCWYLCIGWRKFVASPNAKPPTRVSRIYVALGPKRKFLALAMYISFFVCGFPSRWVANSNPISSGIWA